MHRGIIFAGIGVSYSHLVKMTSPPDVKMTSLPDVIFRWVKWHQNADVKMTIICFALLRLKLRHFTYVKLTSFWLMRVCWERAAWCHSMTSRRHGLVVPHWQCFGCIPWLENLKIGTEIIVLSQVLPEMSWTSSMTSQHDVIASWVGRVSGHHPFSHSTHFYEHFDISYNIASQNFPRDYISTLTSIARVRRASVCWRSTVSRLV